VSDGEHQIELARFGDSIDYDTGTAAPILDLIESKHRLTPTIVPDVLFATEPFHDVEAMSEREIEGEPVLAYRFTCEDEEEWWYVARDTNLPLRISLFQADARAQLVEMRQADFSGWILNPDLAASTFDTTPPPGSTPMPGP
jgi:hypothetical protein